MGKIPKPSKEELQKIIGFAIGFMVIVIIVVAIALAN